jgi:hypothetical protein
MAFLDNSGDIILDAVLTDTGRFRLARGDFKISKFALGDDEIDYGLYDKDHASGSAYYDLEILQTPVLEAFTNNTSSLKSKLVSISRNNLLYLPVIKLNEVASTSTKRADEGAFLIAVNETTENNLAYDSSDNPVQGVILGETISTISTYIRLDQGLDTDEIAPFRIDPDLKETQYIVEIDNRLGSLVDVQTKDRLSPSFIDDDGIASYFFDLNTDPTIVYNNPSTKKVDKEPGQTIKGPRGTYVEFSVAASLDLNTGNYLFTRLGGSSQETIDSKSYYTIDATVRVTGAKTGYRVDIPVKFARS